MVWFCDRPTYHKYIYYIISPGASASRKMMQNYCNVWWHRLQGFCVRRVVVAILMILIATTLIMMQSTLRVLSLQDRLLRWPSAAKPQSSPQSNTSSAKFHSGFTHARPRHPKWKHSWANLEVSLQLTELIVDMPSCQIPDFHAHHSSTSQFLRDPAPHFVICNHSKPITFTGRQYIRLNTTLAESLNVTYCLYEQVSWAVSWFIMNTLV